MTNASGSRASRWATGLLLCIAIGGVVLGVMRVSLRDSGQAGVLVLDGRDVPLEISGPEEFERLLIGLRSYQYRARRRAGTLLREHYYDTADWDLARRGHAYVFVRRLGDDGVPAYSLRLTGDEREPLSEIAAELPGPVGEAITAGAWERALPGRLELPAGRRLRAALAALDVEEGELALRGVGDVAVEHFDVRDKGRTWFELDYEEWILSAPGGDGGEAPPFRWYGIVLRPADAPADAEFRERIHQMERVLPTFYRFRPQAEPRHVRAVGALKSRG